jgi:hypothetical protein
MEIGGFSRLIAFVTDALCAGQPFEATAQIVAWGLECV